MKIYVKNKTNDIFYMFMDIKNQTEDISDKYYFDHLYNLLKYYDDNVDIYSIFDAVMKKYVIIIISDVIEENINVYDFYDSVYVYVNGALEKRVGNIKYKNFIFNPVLNYYTRYINEISLTKLDSKISGIAISFDDVIKSLDLSYSVISDNSAIVSFIAEINKIDLVNYKSLKHTPTVEALNERIRAGFGDNVYDKKFKNSIVDHYKDVRNINNVSLIFKDTEMIYLISKYFNTSDFNKFKSSYAVLKDVQKSLTKEHYDAILYLYDKEQKRIDLIKNNSCEHAVIIKNGDIDTIIKLYIKNKYDPEQLHTYSDLFCCIKCDLPLICPHTVHKKLFPENNLNGFVIVNESSTTSSYCKICGEFLWANDMNVKQSRDQIYSHLDLVDTGHMNNINRMVYKTIHNYIFSRNILHMKKNIKTDSIITFVISHVIDDLEVQFEKIDTSITSDHQVKFANKYLILYIYVLCSLLYLAKHNNKTITLFDTKISTIDKIIDTIVSDVKTSNKHVVRKYTDKQIVDLINIIYDKLGLHIPANIQLHEVDVNFLKYQNILTSPIYGYIFLINQMYFDESFDMEYVLNTNMLNINVDFNNVYIPTLSFLTDVKTPDTKTGSAIKMNKFNLTKGESTIKRDRENKLNSIKQSTLNVSNGITSTRNKENELEPFLQNKTQLTPRMINIFIDFVSSEFIRFYLQDNPYYKLLYKNISTLKYTAVSHNTAYRYDIRKEKCDTKNPTRYDIKAGAFNTKAPKEYNDTINKKKSEYKIKTNNEFIRYTVNMHNKQLADINELIHGDLKIININDMLNIISTELLYVNCESNVNQTDVNKDVSNRLQSLMTSNITKIDVTELIVLNNLYSTLLNIKKNTSLKKYYELIIKYMQEYDTIHRFNKLQINLPTLTESSDENLEQPFMEVKENESIEHDFGNENFDYEPEYSDEDVDIKDAAEES